MRLAFLFMTTFGLWITALFSAKGVRAASHPVVPGPGILGIKSPSDLQFHDVPDSQTSLSKRQTTVPVSCGSFYGYANVADATAVGNYLAGLPPKQMCTIQQSQYAADCGNVACVNVATSGTAAVAMCLEATADATSLTSVSCALVASYVKNITAACTKSGTVGGEDYILASDVSVSNNAAGVSGFAYKDAFIGVWHS